MRSATRWPRFGVTWGGLPLEVAIRRLPPSGLSMRRPAEGLVPEFERRTVAAAAHIPFEAFCELPTSEQAGHIAWHRVREWAAALEQWARVTKSS